MPKEDTMILFDTVAKNKGGDLHAQDIEMYLAELGRELQHQGIEHPIRILLVGGAFILTQIGVRHG